jgi:membrane-associated phospholipid phosphatase
VGKEIDLRRKQMFRALIASGLLFIGFFAVTLQVVKSGPLVDIDKKLANIQRPNFNTFTQFVLMRIDNLGLRGFTSSILLICSVLIARRFKSWRPVNLSILSLFALNFVVGVSKVAVGRTKSWTRKDLLHTGGLSYPSGHAANALLTWGLLAYLIYRYTRRGAALRFTPAITAGIFSFAVASVSLLRNTHWLTDLLGVLFIGGSLLVFVIAVDRYVPSASQRS